MAEIPPPPDSGGPAAGSRDTVLEHLSAAEAERLTRSVMRRQFALSARIAVIFLFIVFALPLVNWLAPDIAGKNIGGFTLTWLLLAVLFYPITWLLSGWFVRESDSIESAIARDETARPKEGAR